VPTIGIYIRAGCNALFSLHANTHETCYLNFTGIFKNNLSRLPPHQVLPGAARSPRIQERTGFFRPAHG